MIGTDGRVREVGPSPVIATLPHPFMQSFITAAEEAVRDWCFSPGYVETYEPGLDLDNDGKPDYKRRISLQKLEVYYDIRFDFSQEKSEFELRAPAKSSDVRLK